jgi:hypothetical protein
MRWNQGRSVVDRLLAARELQRVPPSREHADSLITQARQYLADANGLCDHNPALAYVALYDAARLALTAVLENQGLRPTTRGGHVAPYEAVLAQLDPPAGPRLRPYELMRRTRHRVEYPNFSDTGITAGDVRDDLAASTVIVEICIGVLDEMSPF